MTIAEFSGGSDSAREKLNQIVAVVNAILHQGSDGLIQLNKTKNGTTFTFSVNKLLPRIPKYVATHFLAHLTDEGSGSAAGQYAWEEIRRNAEGEWETVPEGRSGTLSEGPCESFDGRTGLYDPESGASFPVVLMFSLNEGGVKTVYKFLGPVEGTSSDPYEADPDVSTTSLLEALGNDTTAATDTWDRDDPPAATKGVTIIPSRVAYDHNEASPILYGFYRPLTFDSRGMLASVGEEVRYEIDIPEACSP